MLDKILNITPGSDYKNSGSKKRYREFFDSKNQYHHDVNDSLNLSPAWKFVNQHNWNLLKLKMSEDEVLSINILINDIEFRAEIELSNIRQKSFKLTLLQKKIIDGTEKHIMLMVEKEACNTSISKSFNGRGVELLLERIWNLDLKNELNNNECNLNTLLEDIDEEVDAEIEFLIKTIISFAEKLFSRSYSHISISGEKFNTELKIKMVKLTDAQIH